jgi:hypothetical protein
MHPFPFPFLQAGARAGRRSSHYLQSPPSYSRATSRLHAGPFVEADLKERDKTTLTVRWSVTGADGRDLPLPRSYRELRDREGQLFRVGSAEDQSLALLPDTPGNTELRKKANKKSPRKSPRKTKHADGRPKKPPSSLRVVSSLSNNASSSGSKDPLSYMSAHVKRFIQTGGTSSSSSEADGVSGSETDAGDGSLSSERSSQEAEEEEDVDVDSVHVNLRAVDLTAVKARDSAEGFADPSRDSGASGEDDDAANEDDRVASSSTTQGQFYLDLGREAKLGAKASRQQRARQMGPDDWARRSDRVALRPYPALLTAKYLPFIIPLPFVKPSRQCRKCEKKEDGHPAFAPSQPEARENHKFEAVDDSGSETEGGAAESGIGIIGSSITSNGRRNTDPSIEFAPTAASTEKNLNAAVLNASAGAAAASGSSTAGAGGSEAASDLPGVNKAAMLAKVQSVWKQGRQLLLDYEEHLRGVCLSNQVGLRDE